MAFRHIKGTVRIERHDRRQCVVGRHDQIAYRLEFNPPQRHGLAIVVCQLHGLFRNGVRQFRLEDSIVRNPFPRGGQNVVFADFRRMDGGERRHEDKHRQTQQVAHRFHIVFLLLYII